MPGFRFDGRRVNEPRGIQCCVGGGWVVVVRAAELPRIKETPRTGRFPMESFTSSLLFLIANIVTTSKAPVTTSVALVTSSIPC